MSPCPCHSNQDYEACCGQYISEQRLPETPEALMRSRYSAYALADINYIKQTMQGKPLMGFNESEVTIWAKSVHWIDLNIIKSSIDMDNQNRGFVEFIATYIHKGILKKIHENSCFKRVGGRWLYVDGEHMNHTLPPTKISRNALCPCGSNKKFKNCHA